MTNRFYNFLLGAIHRLGLTALVLAGISTAAEVPPDLTASPVIDRKLTYNLGATGLRGWIHTKAADFFESQQGRTTTGSRQILVTHVGEKSPADGVMQVDDVILGAGGGRFTFDARQSIAKAIQEAEKEENGGILRLTRWRAGKTEEVRLKLRVMGTYSNTAPYDCPKSRRILEDACKVLEQEPLEDDWHGAVNGLALMATGDPKYLPIVREHARRMGPASVKLELKDGMVTWDWGYRNLFLCEYYLLTGDEAVLHAIREYTVALAKGQSLYGTFGHGIAGRTPDGGFHGSIPPYGPVNAAGLVANIAIVMGRKCGVADPEIDPAIERASKFFGYFVGKGAIPYGEHEPWANHENNGKNAMAAMLFALQGNRAEETRFFAKMVTASYQNREYGHTGQGFSYLWGAPGANAGGPAAVAAFVKQASWHLDLVRRCDGSFSYDGGEQYGPGKTDDNTYYGKSGYYGLSPNATYVLTYALPLRKLYLTGRDQSPANLLSPKDVAEAIASGSFDLEYKTLGTEELIGAFDDWSPVVRGWAANELGRRPDSKKLVPRLIAMAEGADAGKRQGAAETLGCIKSTEALPVLLRLLTHEDRWLRYKAAEAVRKTGDGARPVIPGILAAVAKTAEPLQPIHWGDPIQFTHGQLGAALFAGPLADKLGEAGPMLLYPAVRAISTNAAGMARATLRNYFEKHLTEQDVVSLAPDILAAIMTRCPADTMFGNEIRMGGFKALTRYHFKEAIEAGVAFAKTQGGHGSESRTGEIMKEIAGYGMAARGAIPRLRELIDDFNRQCSNQEFPAGELNDRRVGAVEEAIRAIESATAQPELRSIPVKTTESPQVGRKPVKVIILAGQSNMEGAAVVDLTGKDYNDGRGTLVNLMADPAKEPMFRHLRNPDGKWTVRDDVWMRYQREKGPLLAGPLGLGFSVYGDAHHFGPELQFGHVIGDAVTEQVLLVKTAWGGKSLDVDFRPPGSGGETGPYYTMMIAQIREAIDRLETDFPAYDGRGAEVAGFVWWHGWNDFCDAKAVQAYERNLVNLIQDVRRDLKSPRLPVVIGEFTGPWLSGGADLPAAAVAIRKAQQAVAEKPEFSDSVVFVKTRDFVRKAEDSPHPGHGHHEFGNAETYFLVGDAMGRAMAEMLRK